MFKNNHPVRSMHNPILKGRLFRYIIGYFVVLSLLLGVSSVTLAYGFDSPSVADTIEHQSDTKTKEQKKAPNNTRETDMSTNVPPTTVSGASTFVTFLKLLLAMAVILGLIYLLYRFVSKRTRHYRHYGAIRNVGGVAVGPNRSIQLIRVGKEILVVGVGESVQLLKEIDDAETMELILSEEEPPDNLQKNVSKALSWAKERAEKVVGGDQSEGSIARSFDKQLKQLLKGRSKELKTRVREETHDE